MKGRAEVLKSCEFIKAGFDVFIYTTVLLYFVSAEVKQINLNTCNETRPMSHHGQPLIMFHI